VPRRPAGCGRSGGRRRHAARSPASAPRLSVLDRLRLRWSQARADLESDAPQPAQRVRPDEAGTPEAAAGDEAWDRPLPRGCSGRPGHTNLFGTMLRLGAGSDEVAVLDDQRGLPDPTSGPRPRRARRRRAARTASTTSRAEATAPGRSSPSDLRRGRPRLRRAPDHERRHGSRRAGPLTRYCARERAPQLPHWREGLRECLTGLVVDTRGRRPGGRVARCLEALRLR